MCQWHMLGKAGPSSCVHVTSTKEALLLYIVKGPLYIWYRAASIGSPFTLARIYTYTGHRHVPEQQGAIIHLLLLVCMQVWQSNWGWAAGRKSFGPPGDLAPCALSRCR